MKGKNHFTFAAPCPLRGSCFNANKIRHPLHRTANSTSRLPSCLVSTVLVGIVLINCVGCQTFSLSEEDFQRQQRGQMVDPNVGETVGTVAAIGCLGAVIGEAVAVAVSK